MHTSVHTFVLSLLFFRQKMVFDCLIFDKEKVLHLDLRDIKITFYWDMLWN